MDSLKQYLGLSANLYRLLARPWHRELTNGWLQGIKTHRPVFEVLAARTGTEPLARGTALMDNLPATLDEGAYASKFAMLFMGVNIQSPHGTLVPHESVYLSPGGMAQQDEWEAVYECFVAEGIGRENFNEPEDHLTPELHFLALLGDQAVALEEGGEPEKALKKLQTRLAFLEAHPLKWTGRLLEHLHKLTEDPVYRAAGYLTDGFIRADQVMLDAVVHELCEK